MSEKPEITLRKLKSQLAWYKANNLHKSAALVSRSIKGLEKQLKREQTK